MPKPVSNRRRWRKAITEGRYSLEQFAQTPEAAARGALRPYVEAALRRIAAQREERAARLARLPQLPPPLLYVIVASGNIYEDRTAAVAAAEAGAQVIAVIRSTGQSLLDFVPFGPTTEGFGGTYATQANFAIMRAALDEIGEKLGRYVMLTNYASGLCMPEIAVMAALERLDMLLNDSMYGILFRDINMKRTFVDQHFSRMLNAYSGIIINTGEDNYLTTADAVDQAPAVLASQFINEEFAHRAGLPDRSDRIGRRLRDRPRPRRQLSLSSRPGAAGARDFPRCRAEVHAADQTHDRRHLQGPPHRRDVQPYLGDDGTEHPPLRHAHRSDPHAVLRRSSALARKRALHHEHRAPFRRRDRAAARRHDRAARADRA